MVETDILIIGAGVAGSTASILLKKAGYNVILIDKVSFPREKLCGGLITKKVISFLKNNLYLTDEELDSIISNKSKNVLLFNKNDFLYKLKDDEFYFVDREVYDDFLLQKAISLGVDFRVEKVLDINEIDNIVTTNKDTYKSRYIIGADGVNSFVRKNFFECNKDYFASTIEIKTKQTYKDIIISLNSIKYGYGWIFPTSQEQMLVGIGGLIKHNPSLKTTFEKFLKDFKIDYDGKIKGALIPYGNFLKKPFYENIILIGDAACMVEPFSGEGIFYAHKSAEMAVLAIKNNNLKLYQNYISDIFERDFKLAIYFRNMLFFTKLPSFVYRGLISITNKYIIKKIHGENKSLNG